jgi:hypothetical protein
MKSLESLSIADLRAIYDIINNGIVGVSTQRIEIEAEGYQSGHEKWKEMKVKRYALLNSIKIEIKKRLTDLLLLP